MSDDYIRVEGLKKHFKVSSGTLHAVDDLSFTIEKGKTIGIVGESGCGKSTMGRLMSMLLEPTAGAVYFDGVDIVKLKKREKLAYRRRIQMIFQDPFSSLDPRNTVYENIAEPFYIHNFMQAKAQRDDKIFEMMNLVGLAERFADSYPHEMDGGRRQRIGIARALALSPEFIICDEPVSALDVSIQAQILNLLKTLQKQFHYTYMFITHDMSVVKHVSDDILVMYLGQMVEKAPGSELFRKPTHPYTQALLSAIPVPKLGARRERVLLTGELTSPVNPKAGCRFALRCHFAQGRCFCEDPPVADLGGNHLVRCFFTGDDLKKREN